MLTVFADTRKILLAMFLLLAVDNGNAQTETAPTPPTAAHERFFGVQFNELIRQFTLTDPTATARQNPYLFTYSANSKRHYWGFRTGLGLQVGTTAGTNSIIGFDTTSKILAVAWRVGIVRSHNITEKLVSGFGFDLVFNYSKRETSQLAVGFGIPAALKTEVATYGAGPVATLRYQFTKRISLGTETSFYYVAGSQKSSNNGNPDNSSEKLSSGTFNLPVAIYFIVRI